MALNQWYNGIKNYIWPQGERSQQQPKQIAENPHTSKLSRINRLSTILQRSVYTNLHQEQIRMFYSELLQEYPQALSTLHLPQYIYTPEVYLPLLNVSIVLKIKARDLECQLELLILFGKDLSNDIPTFIIKNPDFQMYKPRKKYVKFGKQTGEDIKYEAIYGGIRILMPSEMLDLWTWNQKLYYKQKNILNMIKWINKTLLIECFPFSKRKLQISTSIIQASKNYSQFVKENLCSNKKQNDLQESTLLVNFQSSDTLLISINSQIKCLRQQITQMEQTIEDSQTFKLDEFYPVPQDQASNILLQSISSIQAYKDCQIELERWFTTKKISYPQFKSGLDRISSLKFQQMVLMEYYKDDV